MSKHRRRPFFAECISESHARSLFFVELGVSMILPADSPKPCDSRRPAIALKIASPRT